MLVWACDGITEAAADILALAGHSVCRSQEWYPLVANEPAVPFVVWTRLSPYWGKWHPAVVAWKPELVATPCTDSSHCDEARKKGVKVLSLRDCGDLSSIRATVEFTIGAILSLTRRIPSAVESVRRGEWDRMKFQGTDLAGKTALIVGYGRIGRAVHDILRFGFDVGTLVYDSNFKFQEPSTFRYMLALADLVTVHASLNDTSRGMFGKEQFRAMKPGAYFVNTARGQIIDENALLDALKSGHLAGAALDVLCQEPPQPLSEAHERYPAFAPLVEFARENPERLLISPHLAGCSKESLERAEVLLAKRLVQEPANGS